MTKQKNVSRDEVIRIAKLSKLHLNEEQIIKYTHDINQILTYMEQLNEVNIKDVVYQLYKGSIKTISSDELSQFKRSVLTKKLADLLNKM